MVVLFTVLFELVAAPLCCTYTDLYKETSTMFCNVFKVQVHNTQQHGDTSNGCFWSGAACSLVCWLIRAKRIIDELINA